jgi:hypothetical protein
MPPLPVVPNVIKFTIKGTDGTSEWNTLMHWTYTGSAPTGAALNAFTSTLLTAYGAQFAPLMHTGCAVTEVDAIDLASSTGAAGVTTDTLSGTRTGGPLPASACVVVSKKIARRYRGGHPRSYLCLGTDTDLDDTSHWTTGLTVAVDGAYTALTAAVTGQTSGGCTLASECCVSYRTGLAARVVPLVELVVGIIVRTVIGSQRSRIVR